MTDERLCKCGMGESFVTHGPCPMGHPRGQCPEGMHNYHDFEEAAPSTDEGEAQEGGRTLEEARIELYDSLPHPFSCGGREQPRTYYAQTCTCYARDVVEAFEAAIRDPLEERIRELEWTLADAIRDARAENERLREALRDTATHLNMESLVVDTALLPSPPSSTEGAE